MRYALALFIFFIVGLIGCSSQKALQTADAGDIPDWYSNPPQDPNYMYASNTQSSQDMQLAVDKATAAGRADIGRQIETRIQGLQKRFSEETGTGNDAQLLQMFTEAEKTVVSTTLSGSHVKSHKIVKDGDLWRAYVLVEYPIGAANQALMEQLKKNDQMYTRFRASQTFKELDDEVKKYEEFKKQQNQQQQED